ncbi:uncharacterized protein GGS22DRAFT_169825 [Annulohypoxylon maeteangense]|uniref:uncharacterized protein n=1 Tax=Annulohypoxylon maeteangense TaxID=1927788 RepID=UPI002007A981|nr:uncharacterized protein GGS22DRAFT_169825 [Annulohypoxylon maeteangense]KAI0882599.1 hypothetical protein GGS22DRAFT_169825 [Annulohypoxylon maeteangense]
MSASSPRPPLEASDITCIAPEPFEPIPLIADILRTGYCIPGSVFLVEGVDSLHTSKSQRWRAVRLMLGDGELCIQALLSAEMHRYIDQEEVAFGSYVKLERFRVEWKNVSNGNGENPSVGKGKGKARDDLNPGDKMVYLVVEDLALVGWNNSLVDATDVENTEVRVDSPEEPQEPQEKPEAIPQSSNTVNPLLSSRGALSLDSGIDIPQEIIDVDDDFEVIPDAATKASHNRQDLATRSKDKLDTSFLPWSSKDPSRPLKLTKLRTIPNLPYKQNWSVNVLAVVSALSDIEPSGLPPYTQRQARLADPSTDKHVLLTVFLDPDRFAPKVGSVVLLLGVKNHRFDGGSLKKYVSDRPAEGFGWWYENPAQLDWCDVEGLKRWWDESQSS